ncbi:AAA family ATPase [bacterium]|nr:AAA family ATPase [bacterium]
MSNFNYSSSYNIWTQIRNIINEKYKDGFPVIKELIQNANDAEASDMYFIMTEGFPECKHPLLKSKSLLVLNNGEFTNRDLINIASIWSDDKSQENKIGKFGLGLKSIFHWCEAFFWYSNNVIQIIDSKNNYRNYDFINPWELTDKDRANQEKGQYPEWQDGGDSNDFQIISEVLNPLIKAYDNWFYVLIPLRDNNIKSEYCITSEKPGEGTSFFNELFKSNNQEEIVNVLTMMSSIKRIFFGDIKEIDAFKSIEKKKVCFPKIADASRDVFPKQNTILINNDELTYNLIYALDDTSIGNEIKKSDQWLNIEGRKETVYEEAAVSIVLFPAEYSKHTVRINYCSYLPLTDMSYLYYSSNLSVGINFHGYFKVDSGRTKVEFVNNNHDPAKNKSFVDHQWNSHIADKIMLPLLLPAIYDLYQTKKFDVDQVSQLLKILERHFDKMTVLFGFDPIKSVCSNYNLIIRKKVDESVVELLQNEKRFYLISQEIHKKIKLIPSLKILLENHIMIQDTLPSFTNRMADKWTLEMLKQVWEINFKLFEEDSELFGNLLDLTKDNLGDKGKEAELEIFKLIKEGAIDSVILAKKQVINKIFEFTPHRMINCGFGDSKDLIKINRYFADYLFIKDAVDVSRQYNQANISPETSLEILAWLENNKTHASTKFAIELYKLLPEKNKDEKTKSLKIIELTASDLTRRFFSLSELNDFKFVLTNNSEGNLIKTIEACFIDLKLWKVMFDTPEIPNTYLKILTCVKSASLDLVELLSLIDNQMGEFTSRIDLIKVMISNPNHNTQMPKLIRKLFYGNREDNSKKIYLYQKDDFWYNLACKLNSFLDEDLVIEVFAEANQNQMDSFNAKMMNDSLPPLLLKRESGRCEIAIEDDYLKILYSRIPVCRELIYLPIFKDTCGNKVNIVLENIDIYYLVNCKNDQGLPQENKYIFEDDNYSQVLKNIGIKEFSKNELIKTLLKREVPSDNFEVIAETLGNMIKYDFDEEIDKLLLEKSWIKISNEIRVAPKSIYDISDKKNLQHDFNTILADYNKYHKQDKIFNLEDIESYEFKHKTKVLHSFKSIFKNDEHFYLLLGNMIKKVSHYSLAKDEICTVNELLDNFTSFNPAVRCFQNTNKDNPIYAKKYIFPSFFSQNPPTNDIIKILNVLYENDSKELHLKFFKSHFRFLENISIKNFKSLMLINKINQWKSITELMFDNNIVVDSSIVNYEYQVILVNANIEGICTDIYDFDYDNRSQNFNSLDMLEYCDMLIKKHKASKFILGVFLSLIGKRNQISRAELYLDNYNQASYYQKMIVNDFILKLDFIPSYSMKEDECLYLNILGQRFKPDRKEKSIFYIKGDNLKDNQITLGLNKLTIKDDENINSILINNIVEFFENLKRMDDKFSIDTDNLRSLFEKSINKNKANIEYVQFQVKNRILSLFRQFAKKKNVEIDNLFKDEDILSRKEFEEIESKDSILKHKDDLIIKAISHLEKNKIVREIILTGIKDKLLKSQYSVNSVLFELFQNADDACVEKNVTLGIDQSSNFFQLNTNKNIIDIVHNGRLINQHKSSNKEVAEFKDDLLNILMLDYSKKSDSREITGKFGLGFKSVYLICDEPEIHSQDIHLKVIGGCYPKVIDDFNDNLEITETMIRLKLNENIPFRDILEKFIENISYLLIFSNAINKIKVENKLYELNRTEVIVKDHLELHKLNNHEEVVLIKHTNFKLLFAYSSNGFGNIKTQQKIWVTVPTETKTKYNFLINANFKIDVGRVQLAIRGNDEIFSKIGKEFVLVLRDIFDRSKYPLNIDKHQFWSSLFKQLTTSDDKDELYPIFWAYNSDNYLALLSEIKILPNGLDGKFDELINLSSVEYILSEELNHAHFIEIFKEYGVESNNAISIKIFDLLKQNGLKISNIKILTNKNYKRELKIDGKEENQEKLFDLETTLKADAFYETPEEKDVFINNERLKRDLLTKQEEPKFTHLEDFDEYTYGWLNMIAKADCSTGSNSNGKRVGQVKFSNCQVNNYGELLTLKNPHSYLIQSYETAKEVVFCYGFPERELKNEILGVNFKDNIVEVLFKNCLSDKEKQILIDKSMEGTYKLKFKDYTDVSHKLLEAYSLLNLSSKFSFKNNLPFITFVFGPPGTGKTTNIAEKINRYINANDDVNILAMSFSNTACDEIFKKITEKTDNYDWLTRFGNSVSSKIINENKITNSSNNYNSAHKVIITTAIRFSYDGYKDMNFESRKWDYIILDEASMMNIQLINYILYKASDTNSKCKFIIAGDPFQIPPIYSFTNNNKKSKNEKQIEIDYSELKNMEKKLDGENIYKMVDINTFDQSLQKIDTSKLRVEYLDNQYRSITPIGEIYSNLYYDKKLKHDRITESAQKIVLSGLNISHINLISFPLLGGKIYHSRLIDESHAHPYSAILLVSMLSEIDREIDKKIEVGIVSPYRTQVKIIDKLIGRVKFNYIDIQVDTVHGFQGGQKDIMFCVLNPPVKEVTNNKFKITCKENSLINKKYIINVALSRARDYLFILHPSNEYESDKKIKTIEGFKNLTEINKLLDYLKNHPDEVTEKSNRDIEKWCFNKQNHIDKNSIVIDHDSVNIYDIPPKTYVVSCGDTSIDIQIKKDEELKNDNQ